MNTSTNTQTAWNLWLNVFFAAAICYALIILLPVIAHLSVRPLWVDELVNFEKILPVFPYWLTQYSLFELLYLLPLRSLDLDPATWILIYRVLSVLVFTTALAAISVRLVQQRQSRESALLVVAGLASMLFYTGYAAVARPYIVALSGIAILALDRWQTRWTWFGLVLALLNTVTTIFAAITALLYLRSRKTLRWVMIIIGIGYFPLLIHWFLPQSWSGTLVPPYITLFRTELPFLHAGNPNSWLFISGPHFTGNSILAVVAVTTLAGFLLTGVRRAYLWPPLLYFLLLLVFRSMGAPTLSRYAAPAGVWAMVCFACVILQNQPANRRLIAKTVLLFLVILQLSDLRALQPDHHWETATISLNPTEKRALEAYGCHIQIEASTALELMAGLNLLLQLNVWPTPDLSFEVPEHAQRHCHVEIAQPLSDLYFEHQPDRFRRMFLPDTNPPAAPPSLVVQPVLNRETQPDRPEQSNYHARRYGPTVIYARTIVQR